MINYIKISPAIALVLLSACSYDNQNQYTQNEVGHTAAVVFGRVVSEKQVDIKGQNTEVGAVTGAVGGAVAGSAIGQGTGSALLAVGGAVLGGLAGHFGEQALEDHKGIEYIITFPRTGQTQSLVQNIASSDQPIAVGQCVMVQYYSSYQRVMPSSDPTQCQ